MKSKKSFDKLRGGYYTPQAITEFICKWIISKNKDTGITRTARLFYVACTRAENSLAVVAYTENEELVKATALSNGWFLENEIYII